MAKKKVKDENISIKDLIDELLDTSIFKNIAKRNDKNFAQKLAVWLVRYILVISSMNESLKIDLEEILLDLHGEKFREILEITETVFHVINEDSNHQIYSKYNL